MNNRGNYKNEKKNKFWDRFINQPNFEKERCNTKVYRFTSLNKTSVLKHTLKHCSLFYNKTSCYGVCQQTGKINRYFQRFCEFNTSRRKSRRPRFVVSRRHRSYTSRVPLDKTCLCLNKVQTVIQPPPLEYADSSQYSSQLTVSYLEEDFWVEQA